MTAAEKTWGKGGRESRNRMHIIVAPLKIAAEKDRKKSTVYKAEHTYIKDRGQIRSCILLAAVVVVVYESLYGGNLRERGCTPKKKRG